MNLQTSSAKDQLYSGSKEHELYLNIIYWISPLFPSVSNKIIQELNKAAYLYFTFLISFDEFIDVKEENEKVKKLLNLKNGFRNYEYSVRILSHLFQDENFWEKFEDLKNTYFKTILFEKEISKTKTVINEEMFQKIAIGKSAICLNSIYALQFLANNFGNELKLKICINEIHIALQYIDDIEDFKKDISEEQWTYPQSLLQEYFHKHKLNVEDISIKHKYLYLSQISINSFYSAIKHFENALLISEKFNLIELSGFLKLKIKSIQFHLNEIEFLKEKALVKSKKSNEFTTKNTLDNAIQKGILYLEKNLNEDNTWSDFMTSAGAGKAWVTTFVGFQLSEIDSNLPVLQKLIKDILADPNKFVSYNQLIIQDGDSTNFLIGFLLKSGLDINEDIWRNWMRFFDFSNGGWKTYIDEIKLRNLLELENGTSVKAWLSPKVCVSAVSAHFLSFSTNKVLYEKTCKYLAETIDNNKWHSYWWTSPIYATAFGIMALSKNEEYKDICTKSTQWIAEQQSMNGCWENPFEKEASSFYTALAIKALIYSYPEKYKSIIKKGINWLLKHQASDGSWKTNRILQIPATDKESPVEVKNWRHSSFGVNCVSDDYNRVFTTSAVINCLFHYKQLSHS